MKFPNIGRLLTVVAILGLAMGATVPSAQAFVPPGTVVPSMTIEFHFFSFVSYKDAENKAEGYLTTRYSWFEILSVTRDGTDETPMGTQYNITVKARVSLRVFG